MTAKGRFRGPTGRLRGRASECALLDDLVSAIRRGESRSLVLRGEAGIGKTALLEYLIASAPDATVVRAVGVQSDIELAFAGLHQLCGPLLDRLDSLPAPQRQAMPSLDPATGWVKSDPLGPAESVVAGLARTGGVALPHRGRSNSRARLLSRRHDRLLQSRGEESEDLGSLRVWIAVVADPQVVEQRMERPFRGLRFMGRHLEGELEEVGPVRQ